MYSLPHKVGPAILPMKKARFGGIPAFRLVNSYSSRVYIYRYIYIYMYCVHYLGITHTLTRILTMQLHADCNLFHPLVFWPSRLLLLAFAFWHFTQPVLHPLVFWSRPCGCFAGFYLFPSSGFCFFVAFVLFSLFSPGFLASHCGCLVFLFLFSPG